MNEKQLIGRLCGYKNGGIYLLLYKTITLNAKENICYMSHEELGKIIKRDRRIVSEALKILEELNLIKSNYKKIEILGEIK